MAQRNFTDISPNMILILEGLMQATVASRLLCARTLRPFRSVMARVSGVLSLVALLSSVHLWMNVARAADLSAPVHTADGSFIREWLILGPIPSRDLETDLLESAGGEANVRPKEGDTVATKDGKQFVWTRIKSERDTVNLAIRFGSLEWSVIYAYCEMNSAGPVTTDMRVATFHPAALWLNGEPIGRATLKPRFESPPVLPIELRAGGNPCLVKFKLEFEPPYAFAFQPLPPHQSTAAFRVTDQ